jgi:t-SNARE complex subunit (syntaxin)
MRMMDYPAVWQTFKKVSSDAKRDFEFCFAELQELLEMMEAYIEHQQEMISELEEQIAALQYKSDAT